MNGVENEETRERYIKGLIEEVARHQASGDKEAEKAARQALRDMGASASPPSKRAEKRPAAKSPAERRKAAARTQRKVEGKKTDPTGDAHTAKGNLKDQTLAKDPAAVESEAES